MTYSIEQLKAMCPVNIAQCSKKHVESVVADLIETALAAAPAAPQQQPFGYFKTEPFGWVDCAETDDGAIALYTAPPAPSVPDMPLSMGQFAGLVGLAREDAREKAVAYKAINIYGETCYFGVESTARAWAKSGSVEEVRLRDLRVVSVAEPTTDTMRLDWLDRNFNGFAEVGVPYASSIRRAIDAAIERQGGE